MPKLIKNTQIVSNPWALIAKDESLEQALANSSANILVPAQLWLDNKTAFTQASQQVAVWLDSDETAAMLAGDVNELSLIALNFPAFTDGRSYSTATQLRQQYHYTGELRAIGDVLRDQLTAMKRCGFDSFDVVDQVKDEDALGGFDDFADSYQTTVIEPVPLFGRR